MPEKKEIVIRSGIIYFVTMMIAIAIFVRIVIIQSDSSLREKGEEINVRVSAVEANRGDVLAHDGRVLASSVPYYNIYIDTKAASNDVWKEGISGLSSNLAQILGTRSANDWRNMLEKARKEGKRYLLLKKRVEYDKMIRLKKSPIFKEGQNKGGFIAEVENIRVRMNGDLAERTIGYVNENESLFVGIEGAFNDYLRGTDGIVVKHRLSGGDWITIDEEGSMPSVNGDDVITTIDIDLQDVATKALRNQLRLHNADHGCAVVMEVKTGDIRAIANLSRDGNGNYGESYNYAIGASTEPGSTFKLPVLMAALEDGLIDTAEIIDTKNGVVTYYNKAVRDSKAGGYGKISVKQVFEKSSNVGTSIIITQCYKDNPQAFVNRLYSFGLNEKNGISLAGEGDPLIRYPGDKLWSGLSLPQMSYGYEVQMTPLQLLTFYNAVANDGKMMRPRFVSAVSRNGHVIKRFPTEVIKDRIASTETINKAKSMMEGVVERGTGTNLKAADYKIAGKTGTAQMANNDKGYRSTARMMYQASFVGYFPADNPLYSCIVVVSAPSNGVYYGNVVAGSVFKEISDRIYATHFYKDQQNKKVQYAMVAPGGGYVDDVNTVLKAVSAKYNKINESDWVTTTSMNDTVTLIPVSQTDDFVPDVRGMTLRDAIYLLETSGYKVKYSGKGKVRRQSPAQGTKYYAGQVVSIDLAI